MSSSPSHTEQRLYHQQDLLLLETTQKVEASLQQAIHEHVVSSTELFSPAQGLDFLDVKNSLLLSYLIELVYDFRNRLMHQEHQHQQHDGDDDGKNGGRNAAGRNDASLHRLIVMRTVLDKMRGLDKKLRYQIDKLLAAGINSSTFATSTASTESSQQQQQQEEDPLQFRPDATAMERAVSGNDEDDSSSSSDDDDEQKGGNHDDEEDDDDDLKAARRTVAMAREKRSHKSKQEEDQDEQDEEESKVYRAPRLAAVPYTQDREDAQAQREKRRLVRMRASELAQTLRAQYGDQPEQDDIRGGGTSDAFGKQREAARRMAEREAEKTQFEEATFVRLTTTRKEKKERQRLLRDETSSNLGAIANLDNLIRDTQAYSSGNRRSGGDDDDEDRKRAAAALAMGDASTYDDDDGNDRGRHDNGKRKRKMFNSDGKAMDNKKGRKSLEAKNSLQAALFGGGSGGGKQSKKKKRNSY